MSTKKKSDALQFLEDLTGGPLTFAELLSSWRECDEQSHVEFAKKLGMSRAHLCDLEKGRRFVSPERAEQIAEILEISPEVCVQICLEDQLRRAGMKYTVSVQAA